MKGAMRMVANRSRLFSMVRVAMMAGTAQAYAERRGMKDFPCRPTLAMVRSAMRAARARYPESSRTPMKRKRSRICGRKTSTDPTPPHTPSRRRLLTTESGMAPRSHSPDTVTSHSTPFMKGMAA